MEVLRPLTEKRRLDTWEKIVNFTTDEWFPSRLPFGKFKGRIYQEIAGLQAEAGRVAEEARELAGEVPV